MNIKNYIRNNGRWLLVAALGVAVFCYFWIKLPFLIAAREQLQLFLWNSDYLMERLMIPGGFAQYLGEMIVQFFLNPLHGAIWYGVLFVVIQLLTFGAMGKPQKRLGFLLSMIPSFVLTYLWTQIHFPMTLTVAVLLALALANVIRALSYKLQIAISVVLMIVGSWLIGPAIIIAITPIIYIKKHLVSVVGLVLLFVASIIMSARIAPYPLSQIARGVDYYWDSEKLGDYEEMELDMQFRRNNVQPNMLGNENQANLMLKSIPSAFMMSEVAMRAGMVNVAQRAAFEAMEAIPNYNKSSRALCRLVETNMITGQTEVALKYIAILEQTTFYGGWARKMKQMVDNPQLLNNHQFYHRLKKYYENGEDVFFY